MPEYAKLYAKLVAAASDAIDLLQEIPGAEPAIHRLQNALYEAEEQYIRESEGEKTP